MDRWRLMQLTGDSRFDVTLYPYRKVLYRSKQTSGASAVFRINAFGFEDYLSCLYNDMKHEDSFICKHNVRW